MTPTDNLEPITEIEKFCKDAMKQIVSECSKRFKGEDLKRAIWESQERLTKSMNIVFDSIPMPPILNK